MDIEKFQNQAKYLEDENRKFISRLRSKKPRDLDRVTHDLHHKVFSQLDCLNCANCCKTLGPRLIQKDIERISKYLNLKAESFKLQYLRIDEDGDYVFKSMPCPFLGEDNYCSVYSFRPKACAEYPHTDRRKFHQILDLTLRNTKVCPAVLEIVKELKKEYNGKF